MSTSRNSKIVLRHCRLILMSTLYEEAGDVVTAKLDVDTGIKLENYPSRHIISKGSLTVSYPGTDQPAETGLPGDMFPTRDFYPLSNAAFNITANDPGSMYYCIIPGFITERLQIAEVVLEAGETYSVQRSKVAFVFGPNYLVNDKTKSDTSVIACENESAIIVATETCKVVEFKAVHQSQEVL